jgi:hypothetical protein
MTQEEKTKLTNAVRNIMWMARRYAHNRSTYAPELFNDSYDEIRSILGDGVEKGVIDLGMIHFPYASDGGGETYQNNIKDRPFYDSK